ncbi:hypothetical protein LguiA_035604 [Lonicera macranthoides]
MRLLNLQGLEELYAGFEALRSALIEAGFRDIELEGDNILTVAVAHTIGHVAATVSISKVAVLFTHIIKSGEPTFYLSLVPIIGGCALTVVTELNFNMVGESMYTGGPGTSGVLSGSQGRLCPGPALFGALKNGSPSLLGRGDFRCNWTRHLR